MFMELLSVIAPSEMVPFPRLWCIPQLKCKAPFWDKGSPLSSVSLHILFCYIHSCTSLLPGPCMCHMVTSTNVRYPLRRDGHL